MVFIRLAILLQRIKSFLTSVLERMEKYFIAFPMDLMLHRFGILMIFRRLKSVGNSTTTPRDMVNNSDVKTVFTVLGKVLHAV